MIAHIVTWWVENGAPGAPVPGGYDTLLAEFTLPFAEAMFCQTMLFTGSSVAIPVVIGMNQPDPHEPPVRVMDDFIVTADATATPCGNDCQNPCNRPDPELIPDVLRIADYADGMFSACTNCDAWDESWGEPRVWDGKLRRDGSEGYEWIADENDYDVIDGKLLREARLRLDEVACRWELRITCDRWDAGAEEFVAQTIALYHAATGLVPMGAPFVHHSGCDDEAPTALEIEKDENE